MDSLPIDDIGMVIGLKKRAALNQPGNSFVFDNGKISFGSNNIGDSCPDFAHFQAKMGTVTAQKWIGYKKNEGFLNYQ